MARASPRTVRFTRVVERSGRPHVHTLWLPPDKDPELKRAREAHRVMTLEARPTGGKTDIGHVGLDSSHDGNEQLLIFPKSLKPFEGARVIGIKFDLVEQPKLAAARPAKHVSPRRRKASRPPPRARPERTPVRDARPAPAEKYPSAAHAALVREVRAALKELERGKAVVAYQRLEHALEAGSRAGL